MTKLIIIRGASGVGKSTIGRAVAEKLGKGTACVNVDVFPHEMMIDWINIPISERLKFMYEDAELVISNFLKNKYTVVTDGMYCVDTDLSLLHNMIEIGKENHADVFVIDLETDLETIKSRAKARNRAEDTLVEYETIDRRYKIFQKAKFNKAISIDTSQKSVEKSAQEIINKLESETPL